MSLHNKSKYQLPELIQALKNHGLEHDTPSQLSDAFRTGWIAGRAYQPPAASQLIPDEKKPGLAGPSEPSLEVRLQDLAQLVSELERALVLALGREQELRREQSSQVQPPSPSGS